MNARSSILLIGTLLPAALSAQAPPMGAEIQVNTYTTSDQMREAISSAGDGSFVVVWTSFESYGTAGDGRFGQRFDSGGERLGAEFPVGAESFDNDVAVEAGGDFLVVGENKDTPATSGVAGQLFDDNGSKTGSEFQINTYTAYDQTDPRVAVDRAGNFVVVWNTFTTDIGPKGASGQRFDGAGGSVGTEFQVSDELEAYETAVAADRTGRFLVVWAAGFNGNQGIRGRRFDETGSPAGLELQVNTTEYERSPSVAADPSGNFVVVWSKGSSPAFQGVFGQRFNSSGEKVGSVFQVSTYTTGHERNASIAIDRLGNYLVAWESDGSDGSGSGVLGRLFDLQDNAVGSEFQINSYTTGNQGHARVTDDGLGFVVTWQGQGEDGDGYGIFARRQTLLATSMKVDFHSAAPTDSDLDGVLEPGETMLLEPAWRNVGSAPAALAGTASAFSGPAGGTYVLQDATADYGSVSAGSTGGCYEAGASHDCYVASVAGPRPSLHWDATFQEDLSGGGGRSWTLHVGDSFADVPRSNPFYRRIETLLHHGIAAGCSATTYCPGDAISRSQLAMVLARQLAGAARNVPTTGTLSTAAYDCSDGGISLFSDVSSTDIFCKHVHYIAAQNVTSGCAVGAYCPGGSVTRREMAAFLAKAVVAPAGSASVPLVYGPDPLTGLSYSCDAGFPNVHFSDVSASDPFCRHVHFLWAKGVITGCAETLYCPSVNVTREQMAKFVANSFGLELYGP